MDHGLPATVPFPAIEDTVACAQPYYTHTEPILLTESHRAFSNGKLTVELLKVLVWVQVTYYASL